jgi:hypothetical protein
VFTLNGRIDHVRPADLRTYSMTLFHRSDPAAGYQSVEMQRSIRTWEVQLTAPGGARQVEYFLMAVPDGSVDGALPVLRSGSNASPHRVPIALP